MNKFLIIFFILYLVSANFASAAIVQCGTSTTSPCTFCDLLQLFKSIIDFVFKIIFPIAAVFIVYGGFVIMTARESAERASQGRKIITSAIIGILIALLSWIILDTVFKILAPGFQGQFGPWNQLRCG